MVTGDFNKHCTCKEGPQIIMNNLNQDIWCLVPRYDPVTTLLQPISSVSSYWFLIAAHIRHSKAHLSLAGGESSGSGFTAFRTVFSRLPSFMAANDFLWFLSTCRDSDSWSLDVNLFLSEGEDNCGGPLFRLADKSRSSCSEGDLENNYTFR